MPLRYRQIAIKFIKSFSVSGLIGVLYILALELTQTAIGYNSPIVHSGFSFVYYLIGIFLNYLLQKIWVFESKEQPLVLFFIYNLVNAIAVSSFSGYLYSLAHFHSFFGNFAESFSIAIPLLFISPITFFVFSKLFQSKQS